MGHLYRRREDISVYKVKDIIPYRSEIRNINN